jgi:hypothetical protein
MCTHSNARARREFHHGSVSAVVAARRLSLPRRRAHIVCMDVKSLERVVLDSRDSAGVGGAKRHAESVKCTRRLGED